MRVLFAGTPRFATVCLDALHQTDHDIVAVFTQPDRPAGRGKKSRPSAVKKRAEELALPIAQPARLSGTDALEQVHRYQPDILVVVAYGMILPGIVLGAAPLGAVNVHASLLPRWRGAAPIQRAIMAGDAETGVTIMRMDEGLDTGPILLQQSVPISTVTTGGALHDQLAEVGGRLLVTALSMLSRHELMETPQPGEGVTYAKKLTRQDYVIQWHDTADQIERRIRALAPAPGARTGYGGTLLKVLRARPGPAVAPAQPGEVVAVTADGISVAAGEGSVLLQELQPAGGRLMRADDFSRGRSIKPGDRLAAVM